jgi:opacity protein-like surface antigen
MRDPLRRVRNGILLTGLIAAWAPAPTQAQWVATPHLGTNFGGVQAGKVSIGGSGAYFGDRLGFEFDVDRYSHFFKDKDVMNVRPDGRIIDVDTDAMSFMGNLIAPVHIQGAPKWRPYGTAGLGVIRSWFDSANDALDTHQNNVGFNVGGGVMYSLNSLVGLRSDLRYFRALVDENKREGGFFKDYGFWRATFGVTFGFPR